MGDLVKKCTRCGIVRIEGEYFSAGSVRAREISPKYITDVYFSRRCYLEDYGHLSFIDEILSKLDFDFDTCPEGKK